MIITTCTSRMALRTAAVRRTEARLPSLVSPRKKQPTTTTIGWHSCNCRYLSNVAASEIRTKQPLVLVPQRRQQPQQRLLSLQQYRFRSSTTTTSKRKVTTAKRKKATMAGSSQHAASSGTNTCNTNQGVANYWGDFNFFKFREELNHILNKPRTLPIPRWVSPQHATISWSECFGHASFILVAISYAVDDFIQLRLLAIAGCSAMLVFTYFHPHGRVLWLPFKWNLVFIAINSYRVMKVHIDRFFAEQLSPLMLHVYDHHFYVMAKDDFARLVRLGNVETFTTGDVVVAQDQDNRYVRLVLKGELNVVRDDQITYKLHEGNFISESGLHAGLLLRGTVNSCCSVIANSDDVTVLTWDRTELTHLLDVNKGIQRAIKAVMSWDIVSKLKSQRVLLSTGHIQDAEYWTTKRREQTLHRYKAILSNMLKHPQYLNKRKEELHKYRDIHHIDDNQHALALKEMGWTLAEFDAGRKEGQIDEDLVEMKQYGWKWYAQDLYLRIFG